MDLLDEMARRSADAVHADAAAIANTEAALRDVKSEVTITTVAPAGVTDHRRRWRLSAAAAAVAVGVAATGALVLSRDGATELQPADTVAVAPSTLPPGPSTSAVEADPTMTTTEPAPPPAIAATPVLTAADAEVLYEATVGAGEHQLGVRDELRPLAPMVLPNGTLVMIDPVNSRWMFTDDGVQTTTVGHDDNVFPWDAELGLDGMIYMLVYDWSNKGLVNGRVEYTDRAHPTPLGAFPADLGDCCQRVYFDGSADPGGEGVVEDQGAVIVRQSAGAPRMSVEKDGLTQMFVLTDAAGESTNFRFAPYPDRAVRVQASVLADGSVVVIAPIGNSDDNRMWAVTRFAPGDGRGEIVLDIDGYPADNIGKWSIGSDGLTVLTRPTDDQFRVLRFPLPELVPFTEQPEPTEASSASTEPSSTSTDDADSADPDVALEGSVVYRAIAVEDAPVEREECATCERGSPGAPMVAPDGTIIIPDPVRGRWIVVAPNGTTSYVVGEPDRVVYDAVLGTDGNVYWTEYDRGAPLDAGAVKFAPYDDLEAELELGLPEVDGSTECCRTISFDGGVPGLADEPAVDVRDDGNFVVVRGAGDPQLDAALVDDVTTVTATASDGTERTWTLGTPGLVPRLPELYPLPDGSVVAIQVSPLSEDARALHTVNHLRLDGTVATGNLPPGVTTAGPGGHWAVTPDGVTTLSYDPSAALFQVVRYPLPTD